MHGGAAPQVKRRAQQRILEASDKAAYTLVTLMQNPAVPPAVQLAAARDLLDRAGLTAKQELTVGFEKPAWQRMIEANVTVTDGVGPIVVEVDYGDDDEDVVDAEVVEDAPPAPPERVPQAIEIPPLHLRKPRRRIRP